MGSLELLFASHTTVSRSTLHCSLYFTATVGATNLNIIRSSTYIHTLRSRYFVAQEKTLNMGPDSSSKGLKRAVTIKQNSSSPSDEYKCMNCPKLCYRFTEEEFKNHTLTCNGHTRGILLPPRDSGFESFQNRSPSPISPLEEDFKIAFSQIDFQPEKNAQANCNMCHQPVKKSRIKHHKFSCRWRQIFKISPSCYEASGKISKNHLAKHSTFIRGAW